MARTKRKQRSTAAHLKAILAQRMDWTGADRMQAENLAELRAQLNDARAEAKGAPLTVLSAAGTPKPNPVHAAVERIAKQEAQLTRRLGLGLKRTASGQYETRQSPEEARVKLWDTFAEDCRMNLIPGMWAHWTIMLDCAIPEDTAEFPNNPGELPVTGEPPKFATDYPVQGPGCVPNTCGERQPGWELALDKVIATRNMRRY